MRMPRMNVGWILAVALVSVAAIAKNAVAAPARPETTDVTVVVTGGQPERPIKGATVFIGMEGARHHQVETGHHQRTRVRRPLPNSTNQGVRPGHHE